jgi:hypothetical protein
MTVSDLVWLFFILSALQPALQQRVLLARRVHAMRSWRSAAAAG